MGNKECSLSQQKTDYGSISVTLNQSYYVAGEDITGKITLTLKKEFPLRRLTIKACGQETISIFKQTREANLLEKSLILDEAKTDADLGAVLPKMLEVKVHEYEFAVPTKEALKLPSTGKYSSNQKRVKCSVKYSVTAQAESHCRTITNLKATVPVIILEKLKATTNKSATKCAMVRFAKKEFGPATMKTRVDFTGIILPAGFELCVDYDNADCKKCVKSIIVKMIQKVVVRINDSAKPLLEEKVVAEWHLPGVAKGEKAFFNKRLMFDTKGAAQLESSNGVNYRKYYVLSVEPVYQSEGECTSKPKAEFDVMVTGYFQSRKKEDQNAEKAEPAAEVVEVAAEAAEPENEPVEPEPEEPENEQAERDRVAVEAEVDAAADMVAWIEASE